MRPSSTSTSTCLVLTQTTTSPSLIVWTMAENTPQFRLSWPMTSRLASRCGMPSTSIWTLSEELMWMMQETSLSLDTTDRMRSGSCVTSMMVRYLMSGDLQVNRLSKVESLLASELSGLTPTVQLNSSRSVTSLLVPPPAPLTMPSNSDWIKGLT